jgi:hypothetical protein
MGKAKELLDFMEAKKLKLKSAKTGLTFVNRKPVKIPAGTYTNLGPDENGYIVISDDSTNELFLLRVGDV